VSRIGNRIAPGRYTLGSWKDLEAGQAQSYLESDLENKVIALDRVTVVRCVYRPGTDFPLHSHQQDQITIVDEGRLRFRIADDEVEVRRGQMISIPARVKHSTLVDGQGPARALNIFTHFPVAGPQDRALRSSPA
jgi:quercetin dioxygenase-like cupin family protein